MKMEFKFHIPNECHLNSLNRWCHNCCKTLTVKNKREFYFCLDSEICRVTQSHLLLYQHMFLVLEIETLFAMCCENLSLDQHSCSAKRLRQNLENRPATNAESQGSIYKKQLHAEYCSLILQMKQSKQAGGGTGFPNLSHASDTELLTSALCNHWHCGKAQVTQLQSGIWPGSCLLAGVSAGWFSNLDSISFGSPLVHWGSTCEAITVLKSAVVLERNVL